MFLPALLLALASTPPAAEAATKPAPAPEKLVCRRLEQTGSRLGSKKICLTRAQWDERASNDQREIGEMLKVPCAEQTCIRGPNLPAPGSISRD